MRTGHTASTPVCPGSDRRQPGEDRSEQIDRLIHESYTLLLRAKAVKAQADEALISVKIVLEQLKRCLAGR